MKIGIGFQRYAPILEVEVNDLEDIFKLFEPYFDIRFVPEIGIVNGKWYWTEYSKWKTHQAHVQQVIKDYQAKCDETAAKYAEDETETGQQLYWRADGASDAMEALLILVRGNTNESQKLPQDARFGWCGCCGQTRNRPHITRDNPTGQIENHQVAGSEDETSAITDAERFQ